MSLVTSLNRHALIILRVCPVMAIEHFYFSSRNKVYSTVTKCDDVIKEGGGGVQGLMTSDDDGGRGG